MDVAESVCASVAACILLDAGSLVSLEAGGWVVSGPASVSEAIRWANLF